MRQFCGCVFPAAHMYISWLLKNAQSWKINGRKPQWFAKVIPEVVIKKVGATVWKASCVWCSGWIKGIGWLGQLLRSDWARSRVWRRDFRNVSHQDLNIFVTPRRIINYNYQRGVIDVQMASGPPPPDGILDNMLKFKFESFIWGIRPVGTFSRFCSF